MPFRAFLVPLEGTLAVMRTLDAIRDRVGVRYPGEGGRQDGQGDEREGTEPVVATPA